MRSLSGQFARFLVVGALGFVIDGGLLELLVHQGVNPYAARALSFPPAVIATWYLNRVWAFADHGGRAHWQLARYVGTQLAGAATNYGVYALVLLLIRHSAETVLAAFAAGSAAGLLVNFCGARSVVFVSRRSARLAAE